MLAGGHEDAKTFETTTLAGANAAHGGEDEIVRDRHLPLDRAEQAEVIRFLQGP